jgi:hypothetical protein
MSGIGAPALDCYIGMDYLGARTPTSSVEGLWVSVARSGVAARAIAVEPALVLRGAGRAAWLVDRPCEDRLRFIGIER